MELPEGTELIGMDEFYSDPDRSGWVFKGILDVQRGQVIARYVGGSVPETKGMSLRISITKANSPLKLGIHTPHNQYWYGGSPTACR